MGMNLGAIGELLDESRKGFAVYDRRWCEANEVAKDSRDTRQSKRVTN